MTEEQQKMIDEPRKKQSTLVPEDPKYLEQLKAYTNETVVQYEIDVLTEELVGIYRPSRTIWELSDADLLVTIELSSKILQYRNTLNCINQQGS